MGPLGIGIAALVGLFAGPARAATLPSPFVHHVTVDTRQPAALPLGDGVDTVLVVVDGGAVVGTDSRAAPGSGEPSEGDDPPQAVAPRVTDPATNSTRMIEAVRMRGVSDGGSSDL